jgi:hypothetical protein
MTSMKQVIPGFDIPVCTFAKDQPEYTPLHCHRTADGRVTIRWKLTWRERVAVLFGGSIWHTVLTFNGPLQPIRLETACPLTVSGCGEIS